MRTTMLRSTARLTLFVLSLLLLPLSLMVAGEPIKGFIDSYGYGYEVRVEINGTAIAVIRGNGQQATRLFSVDDPLRESMPAEQQSIFVLREGENTLSVEFTKQEDATLPLQVTVEVPSRYTTPLFHLKSVTRKSGTVEVKFRIEPIMPADFETMEVSDDAF